jgi:hypothetical protein
MKEIYEFELRTGAKQKAPFDELKLRQVQRDNKMLKHRVDQAARENDMYANQLIDIKDKYHVLSNDVKVMEGYKEVNEQLKSEIERLRNDAYVVNEKQLEEQNRRISKQLSEKQRILAEKEAELDMMKLENEAEEKPRSVMG